MRTTTPLIMLFVALPAFAEAAIVAPTLSVRPTDGEGLPENGKLVVEVQGGFIREPLDADILVDGGALTALAMEVRCAAPPNEAQCLQSASLPSLVAGSNATISVSGAAVVEPVTVVAPIVARDDTPPAEHAVQASRIFYEAFAGSPEPLSYGVVATFAEGLSADVVYAEIFEERAAGLALVSVGMPRALEALPALSFVLDDTTERDACFTVVLHDIAGNQTTMSSAFCAALSPQSAERIDVGELQDHGACCSAAGGTVPMLVLLLAMLRRRKMG